MSIYPTGRDKPGRASFTPEKEKPGGEPGFGNNTSEVQYSPLPKYRPAAQLLTVLREQHPIIRDYKPLAIGVHDTVRASYSLFSRTAVRLALKFHTHSLAYLKSLAAGGYRYDLTGQPLGLVTPEHQRQAQEKLIERRQAREQNSGPGPIPCAPPQACANPANAGDRTDAAVAQRLKGTRPTLRLSRKEGQP